MTPEKHQDRMKQVSFLTNQFISSCANGQFFEFGIPKFETEDGQFLSIEPECSVVFPHIAFLAGAYHTLNNIPGLKIVPNLRRDFTYPTAALSAPNDPYIMRCKSNYFSNPRMDQLKIPYLTSLGIKSLGKQSDREEYEVDIDNSMQFHNPRLLFEREFGKDLPESVAAYAATQKNLWGWMAVQRGGFEAIYTNPQLIGDNIVSIAGSFDAFNVGAIPDLSPVNGSIVGKTGAECEMEARKVHARNPNISNKELWTIINTTMDTINDHMKAISPEFSIPTNHNKTERITHQTAKFMSERDVREMGLSPSDFIGTNQTRKGREYFERMRSLNDLFYGAGHALATPSQIHNLTSIPPEIAAEQIAHFAETHPHLLAA